MEWAQAIMGTKEQYEVERVAFEHGASGELCKKVSRKERERLFKEFVKFDKDGSGCIDLDEFTEMCANLGVSLTQQEAQEAMMELDKDGNGSCDFSEFMWFWTSSSKCGGHSSLVLSLLRMKLEALNKYEEAREEVAKRVHALERQACESEDMPLKLSYSLAPAECEGSEEKMSATVCFSKEKMELKEVLTFELRFLASSESAAVRVCSTFDMLLSKRKEQVQALDDMFGMHNISFCTEKGSIVVLTFDVRWPATMYDEKAKASARAFTWLKQIEATLRVGFDFDDLLKKPDEPLTVQQVLRHRLNWKSLISPRMKQLLLMQIPFFMMWPMALWRLLAGFQADLQLSFDEGLAPEAMDKLTRGMLSAMLKQFTANNLKNMFEGWHRTIQGTPDEIDLKEVYKACRSLAGLQSVCLFGFAPAPCGSSRSSLKSDDGTNPFTKVSIKFEGVNPFPLMVHAMQAVGAADKGENEEALPRKPLLPAERKKLQEIFAKHDADGSGQIDVQEFKAMVEELGGKLTEEEAAAAMKQLDKDGNGQCDFEEFEAIWTQMPGCGGYSSVALEALKMKVAADAGFGGFKKKFLNFFPTKRISAFSWKAQLQATPGMTVFNEAKAALKALLRRAMGGGVPCFEIKFSAKEEQAGNVAGVFNKALNMLKEVLDVATPGVVWSTSVKGEVVAITADLTALMQTLQDDQMFCQIAGSVLQAVKDFEISCGVGADCEELAAAPDQPLLAAMKGMNISNRIDVSCEGKEMAMHNGPPVLEPLLKLLCGVDVCVFSGYHEKYVNETTSTPGVNWVALAQLRELATAILQPPLPPEVGILFSVFRKVKENLVNLESISLRNIPLADGEDIVFSFENVNPVPIIDYVFGPALEKSPYEEIMAELENVAPVVEAPVVEAPDSPKTVEGTKKKKDKTKAKAAA
eukprot:TRINITY_DN38211_c0_g1_i1.p1 TRINITY_DN38211_c0_g1~~TRINITY_DN38211_c0_g1_i1.p1  ORF type:complete len:1061 (+),score=279.76 TRINITY_DN38211_c0_g1_i1:423-3185(+)